MRHWVIASVVVLVGCGARVVDEGSASSSNVQGGEQDAGEKSVASDTAAGPTDTSSGVIGETSVSPAVDAGVATAIGCPISRPVAGQSCIASSGIPDDHFYCHYFAPGDTCATEFKCTQHDGTGEPAHFYAADKYCGFAATACDEGKECGSVFEPDGACIVECTRVCTCEIATGRLKCKPIPCAD